MATPYVGSVPDVDLCRIIDEFQQIAKRERGNGQTQDYIDSKKGRGSRKPHDLTKIRLKVKNVEWPDKVTTLVQKSHESFSNETSDDNVFAQAEGKQDVTSINTVTITKGLMKDIGQTVEIPFPEGMEELSDSLGGSLAIDPSKVINKVENTFEVRGFLGQEGIPKGDKRNAEIVARCKSYKGRFTAEIHLEGKFLVQGDSAQHYIQDVISGVEKDGCENGVLKNLIIEKPDEGKAKVFWKIEGHCHLRWSFGHDYTWKDSDKKN